jgi:alkanesulfonate monooxygenase SsuD/methylene tetrahydromethanopterin reductase-like flavin-dependent oxidoreductase (luciferase family)
VVTADHISGGRVELGMGAGWHEPEHEQYGFDFFDAKTRTDMFVEQIEIVHRSWTQESFDFSGRHYTISKLRAEPKPASDPHPRLLVGGGGGYRSVRAAARWADEYNTLTEDLAELERVRESMDEACQEIGRDPASLALSLMTRGIVAEDRDDLVNRVETTLEVSGRDMTPQEYIDARGEAALVGTLDQVAEKLERIEQRGVDRVMLQHLAHRDTDMIGLVGRLQRG